MKLVSFVCAFVMLLAVLVAKATSDQPMKVAVKELFKHPKKYRAKPIEVVGSWVTSCAHCSDLYETFKYLQRKPYGRFISIGDLRQARMPRSFRRMLEKSSGNYDGFVHVIGIFRFHRDCAARSPAAYDQKDVDDLNEVFDQSGAASKSVGFSERVCAEVLIHTM